MATDNDILQYAINAYSFILEKGKYSIQEFAQAIEGYYDVTEPRNAEVVRVLRSVKGTIEKFLGGSVKVTLENTSTINATPEQLKQAEAELKIIKARMPFRVVWGYFDNGVFTDSQALASGQ